MGLKRLIKDRLPAPVVRMIQDIRFSRKVGLTTEEVEVDFKIIKHLVSGGDVVVDIGANIGFYTKFLSDRVGARGAVVSLEPVPSTYRRLAFIVRKLKLKNVSLFNCALSDRDGTARMEIPLRPSGEENFFEARIIPEGASPSHRTVSVELKRLDSFVSRFPRPVTFIKCDVEGHELECLHGAAGILSEHRPALLVEIWGTFDRLESRAHQTRSFLETFGYTPYWFDGSQLRRGSSVFESTNYFFLLESHVARLKAQDVAVVEGSGGGTSAEPPLSRPEQAEPVVGRDAVPPNPVSILGIPVHPVTMSQALAIVEHYFDDGAAHYVAPVNPELVMAARRNKKFREALRRASLVLPDGIGIVLGARFAGSSIPERVTGVDTTEALAELAARKGYPVFFLGAAPGVAARAAQRLKEEHPGLIVAGTHAGSPSTEDEEEILALIRRARPAILLVAYGAPNQELWIDRNLKRLGVPVVVSVGGTFDFLAGVKPRAPKIVQRAGLEWLFRLMREPTRWRRMLALPRFAAAMLTERHIGSQEIHPDNV